MLRTELNKAQEIAEEMLIGEYDQDRGIPISAVSHTDLWPGDTNLWVDAYLAIDRPDLAEQTFQTTLKSIRPDGSVPHLMQGSHIRGGIETRWIDRQYYRLSGSGAMRLPNGEWVSKIYAPPTLALSALAIAEAGLELPADILDTVVKAQERLYEARANNGALIEPEHPDELTNNSGEMADLLKISVVMDPAVNALAVHNGRAIIRLARHLKSDYELDKISSLTDQTQESLRKYINESQDTPSPERTLAIARTGKTLAFTEEDLEELYSEPVPEEKHPERTHLSMDRCIEVAHSTPYAKLSRDYLERIIPKLARGEFTRFENAMPGNNPVENKSYRRQFWLPVAAQIVQIDEQLLTPC